MVTIIPELVLMATHLNLLWVQHEKGGIVRNMNPDLQAALRAAGWHSGVRRASLATNRAGIEFEIAAERGTDARLELRYRYRTPNTAVEGDITLPAEADRAAIEDAMTGIYLRIHERPDPSRVFGGGRSAPTERRTVKPLAPEYTAPAPDPTQGTLDLT